MKKKLRGLAQSNRPNTSFFGLSAHISNLCIVLRELGSTKNLYSNLLMHMVENTRGNNQYREHYREHYITGNFTSVSSFFFLMFSRLPRGRNPISKLN